MLRFVRTGEGLKACRSQSHRAVTGLLSLAIGRETHPKFMNDLAASDAMALAEISQSHFVDTVLATAFEKRDDIAANLPNDLRIFFQEMQDANVRRNQGLLDQLRKIGQAFAEKGIKVVALKGSAELLVPYSSREGHRYISDIDILAREEDLDKIVAILKQLGAHHSPGEEDFPSDHHHLSPFVCDTWPAQVEVHRRLGDGVTDEIISADSMLNAALPSPLKGILLPTPTARLLHLVAHAQLSSGRHDRGGFSLRDVLDFENLTSVSEGGSARDAQARFASRGEGETFDGFWTLSRCIFHYRSPEIKMLGGHQWAAKALALYGRPNLKRLLEALWIARVYLGDIFSNSNRHGYRTRKLKSPREISRSLRFHRKRNRLIR